MAETKKSLKVTKQMIDAGYEKLCAIVEGKQLTVDIIYDVASQAVEIASNSTSEKYRIELAVAIVRKLIDIEVSDTTLNNILHVATETAIPVIISSPKILEKICSSCKCC